ncbi:PREDICTED: myelin-associated glycoprotein [Thamnophis sirtalis]|uniref:Myelin-associated glycoprotein n=1 Tax=Thamnophis sirtalis TaxID=35019 RepID=A0A6I9XJG8_9SAUR|nr:PREDICTED: myelin-associated glycoprotein [Thamnophis sirtalis]
MKLFCKTLLAFWVLFEGVLAGPWSAWMPEHITAFEGTCVVIPCRFSYPEELRPATIHGIWYFNSPYPKNYPPVVYKSRTNIIHESYVGRSRLLGELNFRNCTLQISRLSPELSGKYYFRGDLGGYNQYTYPEHSNLEVISEYQLRRHHVLVFFFKKNACPSLTLSPCADAPWKPVVNGSMVVLEGEPVSIFCSSQSSPEPTITIYKDKKPLAMGVYQSQVELEFESVSHEDDGEYWCTAENQFGQSSTAFNLTVEFAPRILPDSKCTAARDTVKCICAAKANPEAMITFELPTRNVTVNETDREFVYSQKTGYIVTSILTVQREVDSQLYIVCSARNHYATKNQQLQFHHSNSLMWAKVGPVGAVVAFAILIAVVCYVSQARKKKNNDNPGFGQTENPPVVYSGDYRNPGNLEKSEYGRCDKRLLNKREDLGIDYANIDFTKLSTKDSYTLTEELAEYAEIRVK